MTDKEFDLFATNLENSKAEDVFDTFVMHSSERKVKTVSDILENLKEPETKPESRPIPVPDITEITQLTEEINEDRPETKIERFNRLLEELKQLKAEIEHDREVAANLLRNQQNIDDDDYEDY